MPFSPWSGSALGIQPYQFSVPRAGSGTDDGANIASAFASAINYALNNQGYAEVLTLDASGQYLANTAPTIGGAFKGNAIIPIQPQAATSLKPVIRWRGASSFSAHSLSHWQQQVPQNAGTVIATTRTDGTNDPTNGPAFVAGGPYAGYGGATSLFSNILVIVDGITIQVPWNGTYGGFGFFGHAEAEIVSASCMARAVPVNGTPFPNMTNYGSITNQWPIGLQMPDVNNNDNSNILRYSSEGLFVGAQLSEHTKFESIRVIYCLAGVQAGSASGSPAPHGITGAYLSAEVCDSALVGLGATCKIVLAQLDTESVGNDIFDTSNHLVGQIGLRKNSAVPPGYGAFTIQGAANVKVTALDAIPGPVAAPQAPPASGAAWANLYYQDAEITLSVAGGSLSALSIGAVAQTVPASTTFYRFTLPSGVSYTPTFTGTLTHTVTLA